MNKALKIIFGIIFVVAILIRLSVNFKFDLIPGINGGYISDANFEFGVNCYGKKPAMTDADKILMDATAPYPKNEQDIKMEKEVSYWKNRLPELLVSPFNKNSWEEPYLRV